MAAIHKIRFCVGELQERADPASERAEDGAVNSKIAHLLTITIACLARDAPHHELGEYRWVGGDQPDREVERNSGFLAGRGGFLSAVGRCRMRVGSIAGLAWQDGEAARFPRHSEAEEYRGVIR